MICQSDEISPNLVTLGETEREIFGANLLSKILIRLSVSEILQIWRRMQNFVGRERRFEPDDVGVGREDDDDVNDGDEINYFAERQVGITGGRKWSFKRGMEYGRYNHFITSHSDLCNSLRKMQ